MTTSLHPSSPPPIVAAKRPLRPFFIGMALLATAIALTAFVPEYMENAAGRFPIAWVLHVHGAIMAVWLFSFVVQAVLGATGRIALHRRIGNYAFAIGGIAWASMVFVEWRALLVHPLPDDLSEYDSLLPGPYVYLTFPLFLIWSYRRRNRPDWHKRLITFALFLSLQAAIQRYAWIPMHHGYSPFAATLDVFLLLPLIGYDLRQLKGKIHPATVRGMLVLFAAQGLLLMLWGTAAWRTFAFSVAHRVSR